MRAVLLVGLLIPSLLAAHGSDADNNSPQSSDTSAHVDDVAPAPSDPEEDGGLVSASIIESEPVAGTARSQETQRPWSCGPVVENQVRKIRKQYDRLEGGASQHTQMFKYGWKIRADDPTFRN